MRTLRNAVEQGKVHHAYLFVGSRGTGKTSMAKILAACLNCVRRARRRRRAASASRASRSPTRRRWTSSRWTRRRTTRSTTSATCASASPTRRSPGATRSTSSTRRTCSRRRPGTRSSRRSRSRRRTRSSCWRRPRPTRCCRRSSTAAIASTSRARRSSRSPASSRRVAAAEDDRDRPRGGRPARPPRDRLVPRRARHARAARHLHRHDDRDRTTCSRCSASPTRTSCSARSTPSPRATRREALLAVHRVAETGRDLVRLRARPRDATRASCSSCRRSARCPPQIAMTPDHDARLAEQAERVPRDAVVRAARPARRRA